MQRPRPCSFRNAAQHDAAEIAAKKAQSNLRTFFTASCSYSVLFYVMRLFSSFITAVAAETIIRQRREVCPDHRLSAALKSWERFDAPMTRIPAQSRLSREERQDFGRIHVLNPRRAHSRTRSDA